MNATYTTNQEKKMIDAIQSSIGITANGVIDNMLLLELVKRFDANIFPLTLELYNMPVIISKDILVFNPNGAPVSWWTNCMSGSFTYPTAVKPCSIAINHGADVYSNSSKYWAGFPESVIVRYKNNTTNIVRVKYTSEIPNRAEVKWAVGGMGLINNYNPDLEGFKQFVINGTTYNHSDVLRRTQHTVLGIKDNYCYLIYCKAMTGLEVNNFCKNNLKLDMAVMLDGGHIPAMNGNGAFAKINLTQKQGYALQAI